MRLRSRTSAAIVPFVMAVAVPLLLAACGSSSNSKAEPSFSQKLAQCSLKANQDPLLEAMRREMHKDVSGARISEYERARSSFLYECAHAN
jgi:major membrane immunogen (membrane-anchored lipoprotein)